MVMYLKVTKVHKRHLKSSHYKIKKGSEKLKLVIHKKNNIIEHKYPNSDRIPSNIAYQIYRISYIITATDLQQTCEVTILCH